MRILRTDSEFGAVMSGMLDTVDISARLPNSPFRRRTGYIVACEFDVVRDREFAPVLADLAARHGDEQVTMFTVVPEPYWYRKEFGAFPAFEFSGDVPWEEYVDGLVTERFGPSITDIGDVIVITGDTGGWAVWTERDREYALVWSLHPFGPWAHNDRWFGAPAEVVGWFRNPDPKFIPYFTDSEAKRLEQNLSVFETVRRI